MAELRSYVYLDRLQPQFAAYVGANARGYIPIPGMAAILVEISPGVLINQVTDADGTSRIVGDADTAAVAEVASWTTPVPGGVGPVTVSMLMRNAAIAFEKQIDIGWI